MLESIDFFQSLFYFQHNKTAKGMETCQKIPPNPITSVVLKLQCANFAKRVLNWHLSRLCSLKIDNGNRKGAFKGYHL